MTPGDEDWDKDPPVGLFGCCVLLALAAFTAGVWWSVVLVFEAMFGGGG